MKLFKSKKDWNHKHNFVDEDSVFVGYDMNGQCCEEYGWYIAKKITKNIPFNNCGIILEDEDEDIEDFYFDTEFFMEHSSGRGDSLAIFKLVERNEEVEEDELEIKYLHLFNVQNGYYSHGFEMKIQKEIKRKGLL